MPQASVLAVEARADGTATYRWDDAPVIEGTILQDGPTLMISETTDTGTGSFLVIGENGQASFMTATDFGEYLISGFYTLQCGASS